MAKKKTSKKKTTSKRRSPSRGPTPTRKKRNPSGSSKKIPWKALGIAFGAGLAALYVGAEVADTQTFKDFTEGDKKTESLTQLGVGLAGGAATYYFTRSVPAAAGVVAGLAAAAGYSWLGSQNDGASADVSVSDGTATAGLGYPGRRRPRLGCAAAAGCGGCPVPAPERDDMSDITEGGCVDDELDPGDLC